MKLTSEQYNTIQKSINENKQIANNKQEFKKLSKNIEKSSVNNQQIKNNKTNKKNKNKRAQKQDIILNSLKSSKIRTNVEQNTITIVFDGARLYSLNELFAMLQYHKFNIFPYKKACHELVSRAATQVKNKEGFKHLKPPFRIALYRQSKKKVDNDALSAMFKYIIDGIVQNVTEVEDDNSDIIKEYVLSQEKGDYKIGIIIESITDYEDRVAEKINNIEY